jgi:hypothetical protein
MSGILKIAASAVYSGVAYGASYGASVISSATPEPVKKLAAKSYETATTCLVNVKNYVVDTIAETSLGQKVVKAIEIKKQVQEHIEHPTEFLKEKISTGFEKLSLQEILEKPPSEIKISLLDKFTTAFVSKQKIPFKKTINKRASFSLNEKRGKRTPVPQERLEKIQNYLSGVITPENTKNATIVVLDVLSKVFGKIAELEKENPINGSTDKEVLKKELLKKLLGEDISFEKYNKQARKEIRVAVDKLMEASLLDKKSKSIVTSFLNKIVILVAKLVSRLFLLDAVDSINDTSHAMIQEQIAKVKEQIEKGIHTNIPLFEMMGIDIASLNLSTEDLEALLARYDIYGEIISTYVLHQLTTGLAKVIKQPDPNSKVNNTTENEGFIPNSEGVALNDKVDAKWIEFTENFQPILAKIVNATTGRLNTGASFTAKCAAWVAGLDNENTPLSVLQKIKLSELLDAIVLSVDGVVKR